MCIDMCIDMCMDMSVHMSICTCLHSLSWFVRHWAVNLFGVSQVGTQAKRKC